MPDLRVIRTTDDPWCALIKDDPVRPDIPINQRIGRFAEILVMTDEQEEPSAVLCVRYCQNIPSSVEELLGRLHFRLSANQNTLAHSIEVAQLCAMLAAEIGIDPLPAKRAGLLHDLGKALEAEAGRVDGPRWGPRPLDIDILAWDGGGHVGARLHGCARPDPGLAHRQRLDL